MKPLQISPLFVLILFSVSPFAESGIIVHLDQTEYIVSGPGDQITIQVLLDSADQTPEDDAIRAGLFSYGVEMTFDDSKATVSDPSAVVVPNDLDFFGFNDEAFKTVVPGMAGVKGNVDQNATPLQTYGDTLLATITLTNNATAIDSYPLDLDFFNTLGLAEQIFLDGSGSVLDDGILFSGARVLVIPEPSGLIFVAGILFLLQSGRSFSNVSKSE